MLFSFGLAWCGLSLYVSLYLSWSRLFRPVCFGYVWCGMVCFVVLLRGPEVKDLRLMRQSVGFDPIFQNRRSAPPRRDCCVGGSGACYGALA